MRKYYYAAFVVDETDKGKVTAVFPDIPGCFTWGENVEHAFAMAIEALEGHLEALVSCGDQIPEPSGRDEAWAKFEADCASLGDVADPGTILQLVPAPDLDNAPVRVSISIKRNQLAVIDRKAAAAGMTRSGFLAAVAVSHEVQPVNP